MEKDYITITKDDGTTEEMEVVATFRLEETKKDCIIYRNLAQKEKHYYAASYDKNSTHSNLDSNFSEEEKIQLNKILDALIKGDEHNA